MNEIAALYVSNNANLISANSGTNALRTTEIAALYTSNNANLISANSGTNSLRTVEIAALYVTGTANRTLTYNATNSLRTTEIAALYVSNNALAKAYMGCMPHNISSNTLSDATTWQILTNWQVTASTLINMASTKSNMTVLDSRYYFVSANLPVTSPAFANNSGYAFDMAIFTNNVLVQPSLNNTVAIQAGNTRGMGTLLTQWNMYMPSNTVVDIRVKGGAYRPTNIQTPNGICVFYCGQFIVNGQ